MSRHKAGEVVIIISETDKQSAAIIKKRLMQKLKKVKFVTGRGENIDVNMHFGMAAYPNEAATLEELILKAEERNL